MNYSFEVLGVGDSLGRISYLKNTLEKGLGNEISYTFRF